MTMASSTKKKICIIGSGISGLLSVKECLDNGFDVACYEKSSSIGGLWRYKSSNESGDRGSVSESTVANSSKEMSAISDFPPPDSFPVFMPHNFMVKYFELYCEKYNLEQYIHFNHEVTRIERDTTEKNSSSIDGSNDTDKWIVHVKDSQRGENVSQCYDGVMICTGHHSEPIVPKLPGLDDFQGTIIHSKDADDVIRKNKKNGGERDDVNGGEGDGVNGGEGDGVKGKKVLVVGAGNSAGDAAVECVNAGAESVSIFMRSGTWLLPRIGLRGQPYDQFAFSRFKNLMLKMLPKSMTKSVLEWFVETFSSIDHEVFGLKPRYRIMEHQPLINDQLVSKIIAGQIEIIRGELKQITSVSVIFETGKDEKSKKKKKEETEKGNEKIVTKKFDVIILATGYKITHPFFDWQTMVNNSINDSTRKEDNTEEKYDLMDEDNWMENLYLKVFSPKLPPSLGFIGLIQPLGPFIPAVELQIRWFIAILSGRAKLPTRKIMDRSMLKNNTEKMSISHKIEAPEWISYLESVAQQIGVTPNLTKLFFTDNSLWRKLVFDPLYPYQYRIQGHGSWAGARDAILGADLRVRSALNPLNFNH